MWSYMAEPPDESGLPDLRFPAIAVVQQINLLILNCFSQSLIKDLLKARLLPHQVILIRRFQPLQKVLGCELSALISVKDLWLPTPS
jgi:hypothetical protein